MKILTAKYIYNKKNLIFKNYEKNPPTVFNVI